MNLFWKVLIGIAVALGAIILLLLIVPRIASAGAVSAADAFVDAIQARNSAAAYRLFSAEAAQSTTEAQFNDLVARVGPVLSGPKKIVNRKVQTAAGGTTEGQVDYEIVGSDGLKYVVNVKLVKVDGQWKILSFNSENVQ